MRTSHVAEKLLLLSDAYSVGSSASLRWRGIEMLQFPYMFT